MAEQEGIPYLDLFENFGFDWRDHTSDGCHPNPQGHAIIAAAVTAKLKELL